MVNLAGSWEPRDRLHKVLIKQEEEHLMEEEEIIFEILHSHGVIIILINSLQKLIPLLLDRKILDLLVNHDHIIV
jgi:hypothetical protein